MIKTCNTCNLPKSIEEFHKSPTGKFGVRSTCKDCRKPKQDKRGKLHNCEDCGVSSKNTVCNKCKYKRKKLAGICKRCKSKVEGTRSRVLCTTHLEDSLERGKRTYNPEKKREYYLQNKDRIIKTHQKYEQKLRDSGDLSYKLRRNSLSRMQDFIKSTKSGKKAHSISKTLGCTYEELALHLEGLFYDHPETGEEMTWDNYGISGWHIDHVVPLSKLNLQDPLQLKLANNYQNLQPMWAKQNIVKSNTVQDTVIWIDGIPYLIEGENE